MNVAVRTSSGFGCGVSMCDYPEQQSGGVVCSHQVVDGLKQVPQRLLKLSLLLPLVQPGKTQCEQMKANATGVRLRHYYHSVRVSNFNPFKVVP